MSWGVALPVSRVYNVGTASEPRPVTVSRVELAFCHAEPLGTAVSCWEHVQGSVARWVMAGYGHVEIAFTLVPRGTTASGAIQRSFYMGCRVVMGGNVQLFQRHYRNIYTMFPLELDAAKRDALFERCAEDARRCVPFNARAFRYNFVLPRALRIDCAGAAFFCSEHVVTVLRASGAVALPDDMLAYETTPQRLYDYLVSSNAFSRSVTGNLQVLQGAVALDV